jgi:D-tyrosyl-tRNA(Tyr) deacylase
MRLALLVLAAPAVFDPSSSSYAMRLVVQRVKSASVTVRDDGDGVPRRISSIGPGILALVGLHVDDDASDLTYCAKRLLNVRLWESSGDSSSSPKPWRRHVRHMGYDILCVSQFTLYGTLSKKDQPDYKLAMKAEGARTMYDEFLDLLSGGYDGKKVHDGAFGRMMDVESVNDGPVTLVIDSREEGRRGRRDDDGVGEGTSSSSFPTAPPAAARDEGREKK